MAFQLSLRPQTLTKLRRIRPLSSSTPPDSSSAAVPDASSAVAAAAPPPPPSFASPSSDIKDRIFKKNHLDKPSFAAADDPKRTAHSSDSIRESLRKFPGVQTPKPSSRGLDNLSSRFTPHIKTDQLPSSIFGKEKPADDDDVDPKDPKTEKELREKLRRLRPEVKLRELEEKVADRLVKLRELEEKVADSIPSFGNEIPTDDADPKAPKWEKLLRAKLRRELEVEVADSIFELNDRLVKLRELEKKVADSITELNDWLVKLRQMEEKVADSNPSSIFGKEKPTDYADPNAPKWVKELIKNLRPLPRELEEKKVADSIAKLNDRLVKLRELEEKVADSITGFIFGKQKPIPKWKNELMEKLCLLRRPKVKLHELEEKVADSFAKLNDRLVKLGEMEEKVADSIAELNDRLVKLGEMEEKVADSMVGGE